MDLPSMWQDLDDASVFEACWKSVQRNSAQSFAVYYGPTHAHCVLDPTHEEVASLLSSEAIESSKYPQQTRWFNFWAGDRDADSIKAIAKRYGVSPRLTALLCSTRAASSVRSPVTAGNQAASNISSQHPVEDLKQDHEKAENHPNVPQKKPESHTQGVGFANVVDKLWHFCSVDQGQRYIYVGFNALHTVPGIDDRLHQDLSKPMGLRIYTSLLLCDDGTVVSVFETPPPSTPAAYISSMRNNVANVFRHMSKHSSSSADSLMHVNVRFIDELRNDPSVASALLFYYLFDDWITSLNLVTYRFNPYRHQLEQLRHQMFETASMDLIKSLDLLGRQLTILKLMYQSYELIIHRLLKQSEKTLFEAALSARVFENAEEPYLNICGDGCGVAAPLPSLHERYQSIGRGVRLPMAAVARFERLLDRIRLQPLAEIEECLRQKESLVLMNFNLVALKESQSVEKLTRITILLAKVTILFLPVSLMTGYFSIQIAGIEQLYDLKTYWLCFVVVVVLSLMGLIWFSSLTDKVAGRMTYKSLTRIFYEKVLRRKGKKV